MNLDPQTLDILKWFGIGVGWPVSAFITYRIGRKNKHDDIQIEKRHTFAEQLSILLQRDFHNRLLVAEQYHSNFDHMKNMSEAMYYFNKNELLYQGIRDLISQLPVDIGKLEETNRSAAIYLDETTTETIESYIANTRFIYQTDGDIGLINTYAENLFAALLDSARTNRIAEDYKLAMRGLRKAVR